MTRDLAEQHPQVRSLLDELDECVGAPLSRWMWHGDEARLTQTENAQPALLAHSIAVLRVLRDEAGVVPGAWACAMGHSVGEYSALVAVGALSFAEGVCVVRERGLAMRDAAAGEDTAMAALMPADVAGVERVIAAERAAQGGALVCGVANVNGAGQVVVSGHAALVRGVVARARAERVARRAVPLRVSTPFHCALMAAAQPRLRAALRRVEWRAPACAVVSNVRGEWVRDVDALPALLEEQAVRPVQWAACMRSAVEAGVRQFAELGSGQVLGGLVTRAHGADGATCVSLGTHAEVTAWSNKQLYH